MSQPAVSHGRGGAANIRPDDTIYADAGIIREGAAGDQGDGAYSAGRGGGGNIGNAGVKPAHLASDEEIVPELATRIAKSESRHVGRGGAGNEVHVHEHKDGKEGAAEKVLHKITGIFGGKKETSE